MSDYLQRLRQSSAFFGANAPFIEDLYESWLQDASSVPEDWRRRFEELPAVNGHDPAAPDVSHREIQQNYIRVARESAGRQGGTCFDAQAAERQAKVLRLINAHRVRGHQNADLDPLGLHDTFELPELQPAFYGLHEDQLDQTFNTGSLFAPDRLPLSEILDIVRSVYTGPVGSEYMHITSTEEKRWIQQRLETYRGRPELDDDNKRWLLHMLTAAEGIEKFMHARFVGQKRFSLEGGESLIPLLDELIVRASRDGAEEAVIGMAHRGRLNVLANIMGKHQG